MYKRQIIVYKDGFGYIKYADEILVTELYLMDSYDRSVASFFEESSLVEFGSDERNISITKDDDSYLSLIHIYTPLSL